MRVSVPKEPVLETWPTVAVAAPPRIPYTGVVFGSGSVPLTEPEISEKLDWVAEPVTVRVRADSVVVAL